MLWSSSKCYAGQLCDTILENIWFMKLTKKDPNVQIGKKNLNVFNLASAICARHDCISVLPIFAEAIVCSWACPGNLFF